MSCREWRTQLTQISSNDWGATTRSTIDEQPRCGEGRRWLEALTDFGLIGLHGGMYWLSGCGFYNGINGGNNNASKNKSVTSIALQKIL